MVWYLSFSEEVLCFNDVLMRIVLYSYKIHKSVFYRTQVNLGSDLWVRMSLRESLRDLCET